MPSKPLLLVQIRRSSQVADEEFACFLKTGNLRRDQLARINLFDRPDLDDPALLDYAAVLVGGASDASVLDPVSYPFVPPAQAFLQKLLRHEVPVFASCFGFQLAVMALGGEILHQDDGFEMGTLPISLAPAATEDPIFAGAPDGFHAVSVHKEKAVDCPPHCTLLAYTKACVHAFRVTGKPFWAFQFHPEVDRAVLVSRLTYYRDQYTGGNAHLQAVLDNAVDVHHATRLVENFTAWLRREQPGGQRPARPA